MRKTRLFTFSDRLIAAYSQSGAEAIAREYCGTAAGVEPACGKIDYCDENGEPSGTVDAADCSAVWPKPCMGPDDY